MSRLIVSCKLGRMFEVTGVRQQTWVDAAGDRVRFNLAEIANRPVLVYRTPTATIPDRLSLTAETIAEYPIARPKVISQYVTAKLTSVTNPLDTIVNPSQFWIGPELVSDQTMIIGEANWQQWMDQFIERRNNLPEQDGMVPLTMLDLVQNRDYHNYVG